MRPRGHVLLITGASGFIGRHLSNAFVQQGWVVKGAVRKKDQIGSLAKGVEGVIVGDFSSEEVDWGVYLKGVDVVVHLAGLAHAGDARVSKDQYFKVNVEATMHLARAALQAGVHKFVFASSVKAVGESTRMEDRFDEFTTPQPEDVYGLSKREAEKNLLSFVEGTALRVIVLRLPLVYGPEVKANMMQLFHYVEKGRFLPLGNIRNLRSFLYVGNLVSAVKRIIEKEFSYNAEYFLSDGEDVGTSDLLLRIGLKVGRPARLFPVPLWILKCMGRLGDVVRRVIPHFPLRTSVIEKVTGSLRVSPKKFCQEFGWSPPYSLEQGLDDTARWFRGQKNHS